MKILITSDAHDRWDHLEKAIQTGNELGCEIMLFAGDFMSPPGLKTLETFNGIIHMVLGNNDGELVGLTRKTSASEKINLYYDSGESVFNQQIDGLTFYMNHFPGFVRNAALSGNYDVCVYGHDHIYHEEVLDNGTLLLNPGEIQGYKTGQPTCMIFDTATKQINKIVLE